MQNKTACHGYLIGSPATRGYVPTGGGVVGLQHSDEVPRVLEGGRYEW